MKASLRPKSAIYTFIKQRFISDMGTKQDKTVDTKASINSEIPVLCTLKRFEHNLLKRFHLILTQNSGGGNILETVTLGSPFRIQGVCVCAVTSGVSDAL